MEIKVFHADEDEDGINDHISIRNRDFGNEPLIGDYRGIELCRINYIPSRPDSVARAEQIANIIAAQLRVHPTNGGLCSICGSPKWAHGVIGHDFTTSTAISG